MSAPAIEKRLWAPIRINARGPDWPIYAFIRHTRREAKAAWLESWSPEHREQALEGIRFARVAVQELR
jgi:hypothetical protein